MYQRRRIPLGPPQPQRFAGFGSTSRRGGDSYGITPTGVPAGLIDDYSERTAWGTGTASGAIVPPPPIGGSTAPIPNWPGATVPFGTILGPDGRPIQWKNPTTVASVPINVSTAVNPPTPSATPVLSLNYARNLLIIQNNSTATAAGDVAPTMYVGFNAQPSIGNNFAVLPGFAVVFDVICPRDSIFIAFGAFSNAGATVVIQGVVVQGTYSPTQGTY